MDANFVKTYIENVYDGDTLLPQLEQTERITGHKPNIGIVDRWIPGEESHKRGKNHNPFKIISFCQ